MEAEKRSGRRGAVGWVDDLALLAARSLASMPRASFVVLTAIGVLALGGTWQQPIFAVVVVAIAMLLGALARRIAGHEPRMPVLVPPILALGLVAVHVSTRGTVEDALAGTAVTLPVVGALLAASGAARDRVLPARFLLPIGVLGLWALSDPSALTLRELAGGVPLRPLLWPLGLAALLLHCRDGAPVRTALLGAAAVLLVPLTGYSWTGIDPQGAVLLLGGVGAARVAGHVVRGVDASTAGNARRRLVETTAARPLATTAALLLIAGAGSHAASTVGLGAQSWVAVVATDSGALIAALFGLWSVSRPEPWFAIIAVAGPATLRGQRSRRRVPVLLVLLLAPLLVWIPVVLVSSVAGGHADWKGLLGEATSPSWLLSPAAAALALFVPRRVSRLGGLDVALLLAAVLLAPAGLLLRSGPLFGMWPEPFEMLPWAGLLVAPLPWLLLFHRLVGSEVRVRSILIGAFVAGIAAGVISLAVGAWQENAFDQVGLPHLATELRIVIDWVFAAGAVALGRVLAGQMRPDQAQID